MQKNAIILIISIAVLLIVGIFLFLRGEGAIETPFTGSTKDTIKVVVSLPLGLSVGQSIMNSVRLAFEEENYRAGPFYLELIPLDDSLSGGARQCTNSCC